MACSPLSQGSSFFVIWEDTHFCFCDMGCYVNNQLFFQSSSMVARSLPDSRHGSEGKSVSVFPTLPTFILPVSLCVWTRIFEMFRSISFKASGTASDKKPVYYVALNLWQPSWSAASIASLLYERNIYIKRLLLRNIRESVSFTFPNKIRWSFCLFLPTFHEEEGEGLIESTKMFAVFCIGIVKLIFLSWALFEWLSDKKWSVKNSGIFPVWLHVWFNSTFFVFCFCYFLVIDSGSKTLDIQQFLPQYCVLFCVLFLRGFKSFCSIHP